MSRAQGTEAGRPLFFQNRFWPMWSSFSLGVFTDNMLKQALLIGLTFNHISLPGIADSKALVPYAGALFALAMVLFSPISGQTADRFAPVRMFKITKLTEVGLMLLAAIGFMLNIGPLLILLIFLMGVQSAFFSPVRIAAMPKYYAAAELVRANAFFNGGLFVANSLAYAAGGALIQIAGGRTMISAILIAAALGGLFVVWRIPQRPADRPDLPISFNIFRQYGKMARYVAAEPGVVWPLFGAAVFFFCVTAVTVNVPFYVQEILHGDGQVATLIMICFMIGALAGAGAAASLAKGKAGLEFSARSLLAAVAAVLAIVTLSLGQGGAVPGELSAVPEFLARPGGWLVMVLWTLTSALMGMYIVPLQAAIQRRAQAEHRARIMASGNVLNAAAAFFGSLSVLSVSREILSPHGLFAVIALLQLGVVAFMLHRRRTLPEGLYDEMLSPGKD